MGESPETVDSVVGTHATFSEATEAHIAGCEMNENIIDAAAAKVHLGNHRFLYPAAMAPISGINVNCTG